MVDTAPLIPWVTALSAWATIVPVVWRRCDRSCTRARFAPRVAPMHHRQGHDLAGFLDTVARSVRAGESSVRALIGADPRSRTLERVQTDLRSGATLREALDRGAPEVVLLRSCMHHGVLSATALEHASRAERLRLQAVADATASVSAARHSARMLTRLPHAFLALAAVLSGGVRAALLSPLGAVVVVCGVAVNRAGVAWISRITSGLTDPDAELAERLCIAVAAHIDAGGSVESAVAVASPLHPACAESARLLADGVAYGEALLPLVPVCPQLRSVLVAARRDGRPVSGAVMALADDIRAASAARTRARIARMPVRATMPLVACVLPSFVLMAVAPVALAALGATT